VSQTQQQARRAISRLALALGITLVFVVVEAVAGYVAGSLALLTDAVHNLTDVVALGLSWYAVRLTLQPANSRKTYGYHRVGILMALINSITLIAVAIGVFYEAYVRMMAPPSVNAGILAGVGIVAVVVNLGTALLLREGSEQDLNLRSAFVHLMGDVLSTVGAALAGILILLTGANWLDPLAGALIGCLIIYNAWRILAETVEILLESAPIDVDVRVMVREIEQVQGVLGVHDLHVWSLARNLRTMSAHILTEDIPISEAGEIRSAVSRLVARNYNIGHATLQLECVACDPHALYCDIAEVGQAPSHPG
jgi:cobalt-zinc-cadmium efflux system protein